VTLITSEKLEKRPLLDNKYLILIEPLLSYHHSQTHYCTHPETSEKLKLTKFRLSPTARGFEILAKSETGEVTKRLTYEVIRTEVHLLCTVDFSRSRKCYKNTKTLAESYVTSEDLLAIWKSV
jgi:hypothetical protein